MSDVHPADTAFGNRRQSVMVISTVFSRQELPFLDANWAPLKSMFTGAYVNFEGVPSRQTTLLAYPAETLHRILRIRSEYDAGSVLPSLPL
jgi:hypothetical protein